jgi:lysophospholipase L1-like esterase
MRRRVLCYGDSNTWGQIPGTRERFPEDIRWTGLLQSRLGSEWLTIEEGLSGRTTMWHDPLLPGRNGREYLLPCLLSHHPLDCAVLGLGTNDLKLHLGQSNEAIARSVGTLIQVIREQTGVPPMVLGLPPIGPLEGYRELFGEGAAARIPEVNRLIAGEAHAAGARFLDSAQVVEAPGADGIHLDAEGHRRMAEAIAEALLGKQD